MNIFFYLIYLHKEQEKREVPKIKNEESFWDKFLSPIKCGSGD